MKFLIFTTGLLSLLALEVTSSNAPKRDELIKELLITDEELKETFGGLADDQQKVNLGTLYWYSELKYAIKKFSTLVDKDKNGIDQNDVSAYVKDDTVEAALHECTHYRSQSIRQMCLSDQLLTYIALVMDDANANKFFGKMDKDGNKQVTKDEAKAWLGLLATEETLNNFMDEIGGQDQTISAEEFKEYVQQEDLGDDLRRCRSGVDEATGLAKYSSEVEYNCLKKELFEYTKDDLTDLDITELFLFYNSNGDKQITKDELEKIAEIKNSSTADKIIKLLDRSIKGDGQVSFGEFRAYVKSPTVQYQLEKECTKKDSEADEDKCLKKELTKLLVHNHRPIWLILPDLEQMITFEYLDKSNNGMITQADLTQHNWKAVATQNFLLEIDTQHEDCQTDEGHDVDLEEYNEYADIPHMVYGLTDCFPAKFDSRAQCYEDEVEKIMTNMIHEDVIDDWFDEFDTNDNGYIELSENPLTADENLKKLVMFELGQGDDTISKFEFSWYVKQQEILEKLKGKLAFGTEPKITLVDYIKNIFTEYDAQATFKKLDANNSHDLESNELPGATKLDTGLGSHNDGKINFIEFWLYVQKAEVKKELDNCAKTNDSQEKEISCFENLLKKK